MTTFEQDTWVWMPHDEDMALPGKVIDSRLDVFVAFSYNLLFMNSCYSLFLFFLPRITAGQPGKVKTEDGEVHALDGKQTQALTACHTEVLKSDVDNLIKLNDLNENAILHNLRSPPPPRTALYTCFSSIRGHGWNHTSKIFPPHEPGFVSRRTRSIPMSVPS